MNSTDRAYATLDKDLPLKEDIRMLGRLLGDTLREQEGARRSISSSAFAGPPSASAAKAKPGHVRNWNPSSAN